MLMMLAAGVGRLEESRAADAHDAGCRCGQG